MSKFQPYKPDIAHEPVILSDEPDVQSFSIKSWPGHESSVLAYQPRVLSNVSKGRLILRGAQTASL